MLDEYSIEQRATQIFDARSKQYFSEVLSGYTQGNYRSAVVMLWSVVVCDLLFKLQYLVDLYADGKASTILAEIKRLQQANERSSEWESKLVESVAEQTQLLDIAERENLLHLQRQRHLAAHPVFNTNFQLHRPNRDTARALIRNALDGLLTKAPILSNHIVGDLVKDLEKESGSLIDDKKLKAYLESKYFSRFNPEVEKAVFKALWKFVFRLTDDDCEKNRAINYRALNLLYRRNPKQFQSQVDVDRDYFSSIATGGSPIIYLINFLSLSAGIYRTLADHAKAMIQLTVEQDTSARCLAWFTAPSLQEHADGLRAWIVGDGSPNILRETWDAMREISDSPEWEKALVGLASAYYVASPSYDAAHEWFNDAVRLMLPSFGLDDCIELIRGIETNSQTRERRGAYIDHRELRARALEIDATFNSAQFEIFNRRLQ